MAQVEDGDIAEACIDPRQTESRERRGLRSRSSTARRLRTIVSASAPLSVRACQLARNIASHGRRVRSVAADVPGDDGDSAVAPIQHVDEIPAQGKVALARAVPDEDLESLVLDGTLGTSACSRRRCIRSASRRSATAIARGRANPSSTTARKMSSAERTEEEVPDQVRPRVRRLVEREPEFRGDGQHERGAEQSPRRPGMRSLLRHSRTIATRNRAQITYSANFLNGVSPVAVLRVAGKTRHQ